MIRFSRRAHCYYCVLQSCSQPPLNRKLPKKWLSYSQISCRLKSDNSNLSSLFIPVPVKSNPDDINVGAELTGALNKIDLIKILNKFYQTPEVKGVLQENGLDSKYEFL